MLIISLPSYGRRAALNAFGSGSLRADVSGQQCKMRVPAVGALRHSSFLFRNHDKRENQLYHASHLPLIQLPSRSAHPRPLALNWVQFSRATGYLAETWPPSTQRTCPYLLTFHTWGGKGVLLACKRPSDRAIRPPVKTLILTPQPTRAGSSSCPLSSGDQC